MTSLPVTDEVIAALEVAPTELDANPRLLVRSSRATHARSPFLFVRLTTSGGVTGYGEVSATPFWSGEDNVTAAHTIRSLIRPTLVGQPLEPITTLTARMDAVLARNEFTKAGVEMAAWDALGKLQGKPVATLLGGTKRTRVPTKISLSGDGDRMVECVAAARAAGFRAFKVKVGFDPELDGVRFGLARALVGDDTFLGADANGGWSRENARRAIALLSPHRPAFIEQPVERDDLAGLRELRSHGLPVVADESVWSRADLVRLIAERACDCVSVYIGKAGGLARAVELLDAATAAGLGGIVGSNGELGPGAAAQVHVACAATALSPIPSDIIGHHFYEEDVLDGGLTIDGELAHLPEGDGLGVELSPRFEGAFS